MKILLITDLYPVKEREINTPRTLYDFVVGWKDLGHEVKIIKPNFILNSFIRKKPFYKTGWYNDVLNINYWFPFMGKIEKKLNKFYKEDFEPDVVIAHMPSGIMFANKFDKPFVAGIHCSDIEVLTNPLYSIYFKQSIEKALKKSAAISCRSYVLKEKLLKMFPQYEAKTFVAPSGIDEKYIINPINRIETDKLKILTCANFKKRKNIDKLIHALKNVEGVELTVIGEGKERKRLQKINKENKFLGRLSREKVLEHMRKSDLFILPSVNETFGMVYIEAMASGCITVCTEGDGIDGIIKNGENGYTVKPDAESIKVLIEKIKTTDISELNRIRENSIKTVSNYTRSKCCSNYLLNIDNFKC